jgi:multisubunit Na+/H+ antiporter MnhG subunit
MKNQIGNIRLPTIFKRARSKTKVATLAMITPEFGSVKKDIRETDSEATAS